MHQAYIDPNTIGIAEVLNNRALDGNFILELSDSMKAVGFLPKYPIDVFPIQNVDADVLKTTLEGSMEGLAYICACGAHRTKAAQHAKVEVLVNVHGGETEDWIEMMSLDNFRFSPSRNSEIGLVAVG